MCDFHVRKDVAPLKPPMHFGNRPGGPIFPRSKGRGSIEANPTRPRNGRPPHFHVRKDVAPLKPAEATAKLDAQWGFPRSKGRGSIEAMRAMPLSPFPTLKHLKRRLSKEL